MSKIRRADAPVFSTEIFLYRALSEMVEQNAELTASALCTRVGISRTALYRYHTGVVALLNFLKNRKQLEIDPLSTKISALVSEKDMLMHQVSQIASLVDHYYGAWKEVTDLLKRKEDEIIHLRRSASRQIISVPKRDA